LKAKQMSRRFKFLATAAALALSLCACAGQNGDAADQAAKSAAYMTQVAAKPGILKLPSGVQYEIVKSGAATGPHPRPIDEVKVHYEGKLIDGKVFDSSFERGVPATFPLNQLIPAWIEALQQMRPGDEWRLYVPPEQGYGAQGAGDIPPNSVLIFRIELLDVLPAGS
jgi:FKBP-type peptidyl-prolyl cis-trans isomerase FklB